MGETQISLDLIRIKSRLVELKQNTRLIINEIENIETEIEKIIAKEYTDHVDESASNNFTFTDEKSINDKINESLFTKPKVIKDIRSADEKKKPTVLIGTDGNLVGRKSRKSLLTQSSFQNHQH